MGPVTDALILTFAPGRSLTQWAELGRIEREKALLAGLATITDRIIFITRDGPADARIVAELSEELGVTLDAVSAGHDDPELGAERPLAERVLARLDDARRVVVQTMQLRDGGISASLLGPMRRAGIQAALIARGAFVGSRVRAAAHGPHSYEALIAGAEEQALCRNAQLVVGASASMIDDLSWRHGINPARTRVIPHFVTDELERVPAADREPGTVLAVGRLGPERGIDTVIAAIARLPDHLIENTRLEVIGDGPDRDRLIALAEQTGVRAVFPGRLSYPRVAERMRACAVFVHASPVRSQSRSVLEAMATGCPVVVTDTTEFDGLVENASTGIRVNPRPEAFGHTLEVLLADADWREMLGYTAAGKIRATCGLDRVVDLCRQSYADALDLAPEMVPAKSRPGKSRRAG